LTRDELYVINKSTVLKDAQIQRWLPAFDVYVDHVREWWPRSVSLVWCPDDKEPELAWKLIFADKSDEGGRPWLSRLHARRSADLLRSSRPTPTHGRD